MAYADLLGALHFAGTGIGAGAEAEFVHLCNHSLGTTGTLDLTLRQQSQRADAGSDEQHRRTILAGSSAGTAADAGSSIHTFLSIILVDRNDIGIRHTTGVDIDKTAGLQDLVVCTTVNHEILDDGETVVANLRIYIWQVVTPLSGPWARPLI